MLFIFVVELECAFVAFEQCELFFWEVVCGAWWDAVVERVLDIVVERDGGFEGVVDELLEFACVDAFSEQCDCVLHGVSPSVCFLRAYAVGCTVHAPAVY